MSWNYRVIKKEFIKKDISEFSFQIHEVYYDKKDNIKNWSADPVAACGETTYELQEDLQYMLKALSEPVLIEKDNTLIEVK